MDAGNIPILVTRAEPGARETAARLNAMGLNGVLTPMLTLQTLRETQLPDPADLYGLVFTSANGVRTYAERETSRNHTAWCVGPATAEAAHAAGFNEVRESAGNATDLAEFIMARTAPSPKPLLHVANIAAAGGLKSTLEGSGYTVLFAPIYEMQPATDRSPALQAIIEGPSPAILLVHSEKGAAAFAALIGNKRLSHVTGVAISKRAGAPLEPLDLSAIYEASTPNEDGLFDALGAAIATLSA